jgi:perosamine synthetase
MIPRLKPFLDLQELTSIFRHLPKAVGLFELEFARMFETGRAISFPYGRSALWAFFKALNIENAEVILPAYTCSVVAHAIVLSNNIPRFVDIRLDDFNMDLDQVKAAINSKTRVIIATHLFGYPLDVDRLNLIVKDAENKYGQKIWIIQDCAHSFGAEFDHRSVVNQPDAAVFGLNISKQITSIFGGMITTKDESLELKIRNWRDSNFHSANSLKTLRRWVYLLASYPAFWEPLYGLVYNLQYRTSLLNHLTRAYHLDEKVIFPPGFDEFMLPIEAKVGLTQLEKYHHIIQCRRETAVYYHENINPHAGWVMPPLVEGATYSHYVIRVPDRIRIMSAAAKRGLQLGELIEYCIPEYKSYQKFANGEVFPNSSLCSQTTINLPVYASLSLKNKQQIVELINSLD